MRTQCIPGLLSRRGRGLGTRLESQKLSAVADKTYLGPLSVCPGESQTFSADAAGPSVAVSLSLLLLSPISFCSGESYDSLLLTQH